MWKRIVSLFAVGVLAVSVRAAADDNARVTVRIEGESGTFADTALPITGCTIKDNGGGEHVMDETAACAIQAAAESAGVDMEWKDYGFGLMVQRIGSDETPDDWSRSWSFWVNDNMADTGADTYQPQAGDDILLAWSAYPAVPLRVTGPADSGAEEGRFLVEQRIGATDENWVWHGRWEPAEGAVLQVNGESYPVPEDGWVTAEASLDGQYVVQATGAGLVRSRLATFGKTPTPTPSLAPTLTPTLAASPTAVPSPSVKPTPGASRTEREAAAAKALAYLRRRQAEDGRIGGDMVTAWSAVAFGSYGESANGVRGSGGSLLDALGRADTASATDIERTILAVRAAGADPRQFAGRDLVAELKMFVKDGQIGSPELTNDDIFGVLALLAAQEPAGSKWMDEVVRRVMREQRSDGAWTGGVDITAAGIQALKAYERAGGGIEVKAEIERAVAYLNGRRDEGGGYGGNSATTAWVIQAMAAAGEEVVAWGALLDYQRTDGSFSWKRDSGDASDLMTAYAVPALLGQAWPVAILDRVAEGVVEVQASGPTAGQAVNPTNRPEPARAEAEPTDREAPTVSPRVAAVRNEAVKPTPEAAKVGQPAEMDNPVPVRPADKQLALAGLSLANVGIGVSLSRLISKLLTL